MPSGFILTILWLYLKDTEKTQDESFKIVVF